MCGIAYYCKSTNIDFNFIIWNLCQLMKQLEMGLTPALEEGGKVMVDNLEFKDCQEGIAAFVEKRKPNWCHTQEKFVPE